MKKENHKQTIVLSKEERNQKNQDLVNVLDEKRLVKSLAGKLKDSTRFENALTEILLRSCKDYKSYDREIRGCLNTVRESGPGIYFLLVKTNVSWIAEPVDVLTPGTCANNTWMYYMYSGDASAYLLNVDSTEKEIEGSIKRLDYPRCMEVFE